MNKTQNKENEMAFETKNMSVIAYANGFTLWHYRSDRDEMSLICSDNYFANYKKMCHNGDIVMINAQSYSANHRIDFIPVFGRDGKTHLVPVPWIEYLPIERNTPIAVREVGLNRRDFINKAYNQNIDRLLFDSPTAYLHGLFAKIVNDTEASVIDEALNKIDKNKI